MLVLLAPLRAECAHESFYQGRGSREEVTYKYPAEGEISPDSDESSRSEDRSRDSSDAK